MKRGGMSLARRRIARANIPGLEGYDGKKRKNGCSIWMPIIFMVGQ